MLGSYGDDSLQQYIRLYPSYFLFLVYVLTLYCYLYKYSVQSNICAISVHRQKNTLERNQRAFTEGEIKAYVALDGNCPSETVHAITAECVTGNRALSAIGHRPRVPSAAKPRGLRSVEEFLLRFGKALRLSGLSTIQNEKENFPRAGQARKNLETEFWR
jgi:hypothetical protein